MGCYNLLKTVKSFISLHDNNFVHFTFNFLINNYTLSVSVWYFLPSLLRWTFQEDYYVVVFKTPLKLLAWLSNCSIFIYMAIHMNPGPERWQDLNRTIPTPHNLEPVRSLFFYHMNCNREVLYRKGRMKIYANKCREKRQRNISKCVSFLPVMGFFPSP